VPASPGAAVSPGVFAAAWAGARRRWFIAGLVGLIVGAGAAAAYYTQTPQKYTVATTLQIADLDPLIVQRENLNQELDYRRTQAARIRSRQVLLKALENKKVADSAMLRDRPDPAGWLETELKSVGLDGGQIRVSLTGENPEELALILNAVNAAYLSQVVGAEEIQRRARMDELDKVLATSEDRIRKLKTELRGMPQARTDNPVVLLMQQTLLQRYLNLQQELGTVESQLRSERARLAVLKGQPSSDALMAVGGGLSVGVASSVQTQLIPPDVLAEALAADPDVKAAADKAQQLRTGLEQSVREGTIQLGSDVYNRKLADVKTADEQLESIKTQQRDVVVKRLRNGSLRLTVADRAAIEANIRVLEHRQINLQKEVDDAWAKTQTIGLESFEVELKKDAITAAESFMRNLQAEKERLSIELQTYKPRVSVASPAEAFAARPAASAVTASVALGIAGFVLGFLGVGYLESRRRRLVYSQDVAQVMNLRVIGDLPLVPGLESEPLTAVWSGQFGIAGSLLVEAVNDIRTMLLAGASGQAPQVIMVTSAAQGEGKTTLACLLALSLAQVGKRVLLVDGDLRNPGVTERLNLPPAAGLGEVLRGEARPAGVIGGVPGTPLAVMTAGRPCTTLIRGLSVDRVRAAMAELREQFDYIVVDCCPTPLYDGLVIGACSDAVLLVVRSGYSEEPVVREACERMLAARVPLIGGVVNGLPSGRGWLRYPYAVQPPLPAQLPADAAAD